MKMDNDLDKCKYFFLPVWVHLWNVLERKYFLIVYYVNSYIPFQDAFYSEEHYANISYNALQ